MPITINGDGSIAGVSVGGLPDGIVDTDMIAAGAVTQAKRGAATGTASGLLQIVQVTKTDVSSTTNTSFTTIPSFSASITPSSASNKVLIIASLNLAGGNIITLKLQRGSTDILLGDAETGKTQATTYVWPGSTSNGSGRYGLLNYAVNYLDSPNTTSATTYSFVFKTANSSNAVYINRTDDDGTTYNGRVASTIHLLEVAA